MMASDSSSSSSTTPVKRLGITVLSDPAKEKGVVADVCFVHGLGGHPYETWLWSPGIFKQGVQWLWPSSSAKTECYWPLDLVARDFGNVRVLTYGYTSHPTGFFVKRTNMMTIEEHASKLLQTLNTERGHCRGRPIIFVAHSLGGILVQAAILESLKYREEHSLRDLAKSCSAIIFFGTPHIGAQAADYGKVVAGVLGTIGFSFNTAVLNDLKPGAKFLLSTDEDFNDLLDRRMNSEQKLQIFSFQEGQGLSSIGYFDGKVSFNPFSCIL